MGLMARKVFVFFFLKNDSYESAELLRLARLLKQFFVHNELNIVLCYVKCMGSTGYFSFALSIHFGYEIKRKYKYAFSS